MIDHVWTVLCARAIVDSQSNNISLIDVIEQLSIGDPRAAQGVEGVVPLPVELVTLWSRAQDEQPIISRGRTSFIRPSGLLNESIREHDIDLRVSKRLRHRQHFMGLPIREPGRHIFQVDLWDDAHQDWRSVVRVPLEIVFAREL